MKNMRETSLKRLFFYVILLIVEIIWGMLSLGTEVLSKSSKNIVYYVVAILLACISYAVYENVVPDKRSIGNTGEKRVAYILFGVFGLLTVQMFVRPYIWGTISNYFPQNKITDIIKILLLIITIAIAICIYGNKKVKLSEINKICLWGLYIIIICVSVWSLCRGNVFESDLYHFDAYYHSIYKAYHLQAYSEVNSGIYGFYGMLLLPFTRIMGVSYNRVIYLMAILNGVTLACCFYVLENILSFSWIKVIAAVSLSSYVVWERTSLYCQMFPHRILFGGIILAYIVWAAKRKKNNFCYTIIGEILCILAITWNVETGVAAGLAFVGYNIVKVCQKWEIKQLQWWLRSIGAFLLAPIAFFGAYGLVGFYNLLTGGSFLPIKVFLFPIVGSEQDFIDLLFINLPLKISPWMGCCSIILVCAVYVMRKCFFEKNADSRTGILAAATILVAVEMIYYVNRPSYWCLYIVIPVMGILMGWLAENTGNYNGKIPHVVSAWLITILTMMTLVFPVRMVMQQKEYTQQRDMEKIEKFADEVKNIVPADTIGFGEGIDEIYSLLGWNAGYYGMDMPDIIYSNKVCVDYIFNLIEEADSIFVYDDSLNTLSYYYGNNTWKEEEFLKNHTCVADLYYGDNDKYNYRLYIKNK